MSLFLRKKAIYTLAKNEQGGITLLMGFSIFMLVAAAGASIDMARLQSVHSQLSQALDAAGLAAGAKVSTSDVNAVVSDYLHANFPDHYMDSDIKEYHVTVSADNQKLTLDATATTTMRFMPLFGIDTVDVSATSEITRENKGMELVMVMDTTGSMSDYAGNGVDKITAAKSAAGDLLNILFGDKPTATDLWVGMVPFAQAVNIGISHSNWTTADAYDWGPAGNGWMGCVDARESNDRDTTDDTPLVAAFPKYHWQCDGNNGWYGTNSSKNNCSTGAGKQYKTPLSTSRGPNKTCSQAITPLTASKQTVLDAVATLSPNGNTHIVQGAVWAWRMLSPQWRGLWGGQMDTNQLPLDYNTPLMSKVVVLMTDGDNTISNGAHGAYGYLSEGRLGSTNATTAENTLNSRTAQVCQRMKDQGIIIYTVAFGTSISATAQNLLKACATKEPYYFYSPTAADLQTSFRQIGDSLAKLMISH